METRDSDLCLLFRLALFVCIDKGVLKVNNHNGILSSGFLILVNNLENFIYS